MEIVILDGQTVVCNDLTWEDLEKLGHVQAYADSTREEALVRVANAQALFTSKVKIDASVMDAAPNLKFIAALATGFDNIDVTEAKRRGIAVCNIPAYSTEGVAQHTMALILELSNSIGFHNGLVHEGKWDESRGFCFFDKPLTLLSGRSLGIVGYGNIGKRVAQMAKVFGMDIKIFSRDGDEALRADFVSLHMPANEDTLEFINKETIAKMKDGAYLINTARGKLINEKDLIEALDSGKLAGFAADVLYNEPPATDEPMHKHPKCIITPHNCWCAPQIREKICKISADNLKSWLSGGTLNRVD